jgi:hypothetical protein
LNWNAYVTEEKFASNVQLQRIGPIERKLGFAASKNMDFVED